MVTTLVVASVHGKYARVPVLLKQSENRWSLNDGGNSMHRSPDHKLARNHPEIGDHCKNHHTSRFSMENGQPHVLFTDVITIILFPYLLQAASLISSDVCLNFNLYVQAFCSVYLV